MISKEKRPLLIVVSTSLILLIPLVAMQFTDEVNWELGDFFIAAFLLCSTGLICELAIRKIGNIKYRIAICIAILAVLLLAWVELAVGIFGSSFAGS